MPASIGKIIPARLDVPDVPTLFERLIQLVNQHQHHIPPAETLQQLLRRERDIPTAIGHAIAIPHAHVPTLESHLCVVALLPNGLDFNAHDHQPVRLAFLLLSPADDPEGHLAAIATIARIASDPSNRQRLLAAPDESAILTILNAIDTEHRQPLP